MQLNMSQEKEIWETSLVENIASVSCVNHHDATSDSDKNNSRTCRTQTVYGGETKNFVLTRSKTDHDGLCTNGNVTNDKESCDGEGEWHEHTIPTESIENNTSTVSDSSCSNSGEYRPVLRKRSRKGHRDLEENSNFKSSHATSGKEDLDTGLLVTEKSVTNLVISKHEGDKDGKAKGDPVLVQKIYRIQKVLDKLDAGSSRVEPLRQLAISKGGLVTDALRQQGWPKLLNRDPANLPEKPDSNILTSHRDYNQVVLDVNRTLKRFPPGMEDEERLELQDQLIDVIMRVLVLRPELYYYQGYHDICVTLLLVLGEDLTVALMDELSTSHLREFLDNNMERTKQLLSYLYPIIGRYSLKLKKYMERAEVGTVFCLPWLITWYGHVLNDLKHILRLYDFFIACQPLMPIYLAAAIVLYREEEILTTDCDMPMIHCLLSRIPEDLPYEHLLQQAGDMYLMYPPKTLKEEADKWYQESLIPKPRLGAGANILARPRGQKRRAGMFIGVMGWGLAFALSAAAIAAWRNTSDWQWLNSVADWHWWLS